MAELLLVDYGCLLCSTRFKPGELMHFTILGEAHAEREQADAPEFHLAMSTCATCAERLGNAYMPENVWSVREQPTEPTWPKLFGNAVLQGAACFIFRMSDDTHILLLANHGDHQCPVFVPVMTKEHFERKFAEGREDVRCSADGLTRWVKSIDGGEPPAVCTRTLAAVKVKDMTAVRPPMQAERFGFVETPVIKPTTEYAQ